MTVKLDPKLPKAYNGVDLVDYAISLIEHPKDVRVAIIYFDCPKIVEDTFAAYESKDPTIRIRRIEPLTGDDEIIAREILEKVYADRIGADSLPFDAESDAKENGSKPKELPWDGEPIVDAEIIDESVEQSNVTPIKKARKKSSKIKTATKEK